MISRSRRYICCRQAMMRIMSSWLLKVKVSTTRIVSKMAERPSSVRIPSSKGDHAQCSLGQPPGVSSRRRPPGRKVWVDEAPNQRVGSPLCIASPHDEIRSVAPKWEAARSSPESSPYT